MRLLPLFLLAACAGGDDTDLDTDADTEPAGPPHVVFTTTLGSFTVELDETSSPITAANFLVYVDEGFYDGDEGKGATLFHRVIPEFMAQGGGELFDGSLKTTHDPITLESQNGRSNTRGTIAMARTNVADSATSQFFVNVVDNTFLDYQNAGNPGYAVFGDVIEGMDVIDDIVAQPRDGADRPNTDIVITDCERG